MVVFNDPVPCPDAPARAVRLAVAMRDRVWELAEGWSRLGYDLHPASASRWATRRSAGSASSAARSTPPVGSVPILAERLCEAAGPGQILVSQRVHAATEGLAIAQALGELSLRGFARPAQAFDVVGLEPSLTAAAAAATAAAAAATAAAVAARAAAAVAAAGPRRRRRRRRSGWWSRSEAMSRLAPTTWPSARSSSPSMANSSGTPAIVERPVALHHGERPRQAVAHRLVHDRLGAVVQVVAERPLAEVVVRAGHEDHLVPRDVDGPRGHPERRVGRRRGRPGTTRAGPRARR